MFSLDKFSIDKMLSNPTLQAQAFGRIPLEARTKMGVLAELADTMPTDSAAPAWLQPLYEAAESETGTPAELLEALAGKLSAHRPDVVGGLFARPGVPSVQLEELRTRSPQAVAQLRADVRETAQQLAQLRSEGGSWPEAVRAFLEGNRGELGGIVLEELGEAVEDIVRRMLQLILRKLPAAYLAFFRQLLGAS